MAARFTHTYVHVALPSLISARRPGTGLQVKPSSEDATHTWHTPTYCTSCCCWGGAGCRLDHGAWVGVEEWVDRYAPCFRARGVQRIRCCKRIRKLACERASRWKTALRSSAKLEQAAASSPIVAVQILSNSWMNRKLLCVLFYSDCETFSSNCCCSGWYWAMRVCVKQLGKWGSACLTGWTGAFTCVC